MFFPLDYYASGERGAVREWTKRFAVMSWADWLTFDAIAAAPSVSAPTLMVHADEAALPENARRFFAALPGPKHLFWTVGTQIDFYRSPAASRSRRRRRGRSLQPHARSARRRGHARRSAGDHRHDHQLLHAIDRRDWTAIAGVLAEQIRTDYTSLFGGSVRTQSARELIAAWRALLPGFDATQHLTGPVAADVSGDTARARCAATGVHCLGRDHWTVSGHYDMELTRTGNAWRISGITYLNVLVTGDETLPQKAQARAQR